MHGPNALRASRWPAAALLIAFALSMLSACGGKGSSANPPIDLAAKAGDTQVTLTWTDDSNVDYWVFFAPAASINTTNWVDIPGARVLQNVHSPLMVTGLVNGTTYSFAMNGRVNGGPAGPGSPSVSAVPRAAGDIWTLGAPIGTTDLNGVAFGTVLGVNTFVVVGAGGRIASSTDGSTWTASTSTGTSANLNAASFFGTTYVAVGAGGAAVYSTDGVNWTAASSTATSNNLYGVAVSFGGIYVAVGAGGTIVYSTNGTSWTAATSGTTSDLLAVTYAGNRYIAVGAGGTMLTSTNAVNWTSLASGTTFDLSGVAYGIDASSSATRYVAGGAGGVLVTSTDGSTWTAATALPVGAINAIAYGRQFVLVGNSGAIYTSTTGTSWVAQTSGTTSDLKAVAPSPYAYVAAGAAGTNLSSF